MNFELGYSKSTVKFEIDDKNLATVINPNPVDVQVGGRNAVIMPGCRFTAEDPDTEFNQVQVKLVYALFIHPEFEHIGDGKFLQFPEITAAAGQEEVFRQLLGDGGTP